MDNTLTGGGSLRPADLAGQVEIYPYKKKSLTVCLGLCMRGEATRNLFYCLNKKFHDNCLNLCNTRVFSEIFYKRRQSENLRVLTEPHYHYVHCTVVQCSILLAKHKHLWCRGGGGVVTVLMWKPFSRNFFEKLRFFYCLL
jgi:hypothetical protein